MFNAMLKRNVKTRKLNSFQIELWNEQFHPLTKFWFFIVNFKLDGIGDEPSVMAKTKFRPPSNAEVVKKSYKEALTKTCHKTAY